MAAYEERSPLTYADMSSDPNGENEPKVQLHGDEFSCKTSPSDVTLIVEDKPIPINKGLLAFASPVFDVMFSGDFKERNQKEFPLPGKKFNAFVEFLRCLFPNIIKRVTRDNVNTVLPLAHEYQVEHLVTSCENVLLDVLSDDENTKEIYKIIMSAINYDLKELKEKCINVLARRPFEEIEDAEYEHEFPGDVMDTIKARMLENLADTCKEVFLPINTRKVFYSFLGEMTNERELVMQFKNGNILGDCKACRFAIDTESKFDMCINDKMFSFELKKLSLDWNSFKLKLHIERESGETDNNQYTCFVNVANWMDRTKMIRRKVIPFTFGQNEMMDFQLKYSLSFDDFSKYSNGFVRDGKIDIQIYLFRVENTE